MVIVPCFQLRLKTHGVHHDSPYIVDVELPIEHCVYLITCRSSTRYNEIIDMRYHK